MGRKKEHLLEYEVKCMLVAENSRSIPWTF